MKYKIFWCKVNKHFTDKRLNSDYMLWKNGIFVASCVVTDKAKKKRIKFVNKSLEELNENEKIYISWCWAFENWTAQDNFYQIYPELEKHKKYIEILWEDPEIIENAKSKIENNYSIPVRKELEGWFKKLDSIGSKLKWIYTKKFVLIQWWCDSFCTFCLTVKKRWRHFFRDKEDIVSEIIKFENTWWKEVVLTWVNLTAWWLDSTNDLWRSRFSELLEYILENTKIPRIRISSLWPEFVDERCLEIFKNERIYPHFHFSVQSGSSKVLKDMARHYDWQYIKDLLLKTKSLKRDDGVDISLWADIIVWFPWETEEDFLETFALVKEVWIQKLHAFPFSAHEMWESVPAWKFKNQVSENIKKQRLKSLTDLWDEIRSDFIKSQKWKKLKVLIESVKYNKENLAKLGNSQKQEIQRKEFSLKWIYWVVSDWKENLFDNEVRSFWEFPKWKWWTQNYIEATEDNFEIISWEVKRNEIVEGRLV